MYSCLIGQFRTFEADSLYIWGWFHTFVADSLYIWGRFSIHLRPILYIWGRDNLFSHVICLSQSDSSDRYTFEAERKSASNVQNRPQMYRESASNVRTFEADRTLSGEGVRSSGQSRWFHGQSHYSGPRIGRPCPVESDRPQMYVWKSASNVQNRPQMYRSTNF